MIKQFLNFNTYKVGDYILLKDSTLEFYKKGYNLYKFAKIESIASYSTSSYILQAIFKDSTKKSSNFSVDNFAIPIDFIERKLTKKEIEKLDLTINTNKYNL